jgi:two-component system capsular synthesis sensor histidine kinase RcsC
LILGSFLKVSQVKQARVSGGQITSNADDVPQRAIFRSAVVEQILLALLSNALKFNPQNEAKLTVSLRDYKDKIGLCFAVTDDGPGISVADQQRIFEPFFKSGDVSATRGKGLGLTVAKALALKIDAILEHIRNTVRGSTFELTVGAQFPPA